MNLAHHERCEVVNQRVDELENRLIIANSVFPRRS